MVWFLFGLLLIWHIFSMYRSAMKRNHLSYLITYLLLKDEIYIAQKSGFHEWIRNAEAETPEQLSQMASEATERLADQLAAGDPTNPKTSSALGATAMLWKVKTDSATEQTNRPS